MTETECERIIRNGILPESFLQEEERDGFIVTTHRKKIWAIELDLLLQFDKVCREHHLKYWLFYGSLLGAVRHHGFIPWDDDMDVMMPREDYDVLVELSADFEDPYFLQTPDTDPGYYFSFAKLRNSRTTGISKMFAFEKWNQGICLDIFPNDICRIEDAPQVFNRIKYLNIENSTFMRMSNPYLDEDNKKRVAQYSGLDPMQSCKEIHQIAKQFKDDTEEHCCCLVCTLSVLEKKIHLTSWYETLDYCDFEGFRFPIPHGYHEILSKQYGDYMKFPPVEKRLGHWGALFDPDKPYACYLGTNINMLT